MINRVDGQHNYTNPYERQKRKSGRVEADAPAFLLDYDEKGVVWERSSEQQKGQIPKENAASGEKKEAKKEKKAVPVKQKEEPVAEETKAPSEGIFQGILKRLRGLVQGVLNLVWYSGEEEKKATEAEENKAETSVTEIGEAEDTIIPVADEQAEDPQVSLELSEEDEDRELRDLLAKKDNKAFMDRLTRGNRRKPARNTTVLTSYDRHGRLVKPEDAEAGRILHHEQNGDKNEVTVREQGTYRKYI
ncbi:MAG: hypothetical protein IKQ27_00400 [Lachnospiraceae bacterium]|nr:hypothetical protein [Lachnospiraceae bacterium]MBR3736932.1 hypothetical protein [Lachnospiraceae bacterium]MBR6155391.1 hypothetical protein [Lachnospiraceae bacterium]